MSTGKATPDGKAFVLEISAFQHLPHSQGHQWGAQYPNNLIPGYGFPGHIVEYKN